MLVVSWLNPLAWLEGMLLVGAMSSSQDAAGFATGFLAASAIKFYGWSFAGMSLSRYFDGAIARKRLDAIAGLVLLATAAMIATSLLRPHLGS
jgi:L-lysine exporter family protein LysE/ArgO